MDNTGQFEGDRLWGLYAGTVVNRDDPERLGRIKVLVPGLIEPESSWALPRGGGSRYRGALSVPPMGCDVFVQFVNGDPNMPTWEPGPYGAGEAFPEHLDPDISVFGVGPFRLVIDERPDVQTAAVRIMKTVGTAEEMVVELLFDALGNGVRLFATSAIQLSALGLIDLDCAGDVQVKGRKVLPVRRPLNG
jgi:hypothetical protein